MLSPEDFEELIRWYDGESGAFYPEAATDADCEAAKAVCYLRTRHPPLQCQSCSPNPCSGCSAVPGGWGR